MQVKWFRGVDHNTPIDQIKKMYLALVKEHHPDSSYGSGRRDGVSVGSGHAVRA